MTVRSMTYCAPATMLLRVSIYCMALFSSASADKGRSLQGSTAPDNVSSKLMIHVSVLNRSDRNRDYNSGWCQFDVSLYMDCVRLLLS